MNLVLREIVVKGIVHCSMEETREMVKFVNEHEIQSHLSLLTMEEAEHVIAKSQARVLVGRPVVKIEG
jgi:D-arabinose 1-dehydrogenase-like Zn-dependent alcohol dehydrogenase